MFFPSRALIRSKLISAEKNRAQFLAVALSYRQMSPNKEALFGETWGIL
jgi:hypothetical protein